MPKAKQSETPTDLLKFVINQDVLKTELGFIQGVVEKKSSTLPVLSKILIESVGEGVIRITGTNLDVTVRCEAEADIQQPGAICVHAQKLFDIVRLLDGSDLNFTKEENHWVKLTCGASKFRLAGTDREQFPEQISAKIVPLKLSASLFNHFINNTAFAITNQQSRFTLSGAKFIIDGSVARMVTTDGYRLAIVEKELKGELSENMDVLIPKIALTELVKISGDSKNDVSFGEDPNHIFFEIDGRLVIARKLMGSFPNYEMVIPKDNDKVVTFEPEKLHKAIRRVALMSDDNRLISISKGEIEISARSSEEGEASEKIKADYDGEETEIGFNAKQLEDVLNLPVTNLSEGKKASISFLNSVSQIIFTTKNDENFRYVLVPVRL
jgi:DNA polymerase III subunit beta